MSTPWRAGDRPGSVAISITGEVCTVTYGHGYGRGLVRSVQDLGPGVQSSRPIVAGQCCAFALLAAVCQITALPPGTL